VPVPNAQGFGLVVYSLKNDTSGPPGAGLRVAGVGFGACDTVYVFFDGTRIGSAEPGAGGRISANLNVPGNADPGEHRVTSACRSSGTPVVAETVFQVTEADIHRTEIISSLPTPDQVDFSVSAVLASAVAAGGVVLLIAFPGELFNTTLEGHYDEVRAWLRLRPKRTRTVRHDQTGPFLVYLAIAGLLYSLINPAFRFDRSSLAAATGLTLSVGIVTLAFDLPALLYVHRRDGEWGRLEIHPGTLLVAAGCVLLSRVTHFVPGYFYGLVAGLSFSRPILGKMKGRLEALSAAFVLGLSIASWLAMLPVSAIADRPGASIFVLILEATLGGIFWCGLDTLVIGLMPLRFLRGADVRKWSHLSWWLLFALTQLAFVHILLRPSTGYVADTKRAPTTIVIGLFFLFGVVSVIFWAYFRFRSDPAEDETADVSG
jgi:hypothetical protein